MIGVLDLPSGISGDMFLGALIDAGASMEAMNRAVNAATGGRVTLRAEPVVRCGMRGTKVHVQLDGERIEEAGGPHAPGHSHDPGHGLGADDHSHDQAHAASHTHRSWSEIRGVLESASLDPAVRRDSLAVFAALAAAEAQVHGSDMETVHFHEVGGWDAVADIVGAAAGIADLGLTRLYHGPVALGGGTVQAAHGTLPVPAPATLELLRGRSCVSRGDGGELTTPTGAALLSALAEPMPPHLTWAPDRAGYGAGRADPPDRPNLTRLTLGMPSTEATPGTERVAVIEASLDDMTPEEAGLVVETLLDRGALDATLTPLIMKKGRPGFLIRVVVSASGSGASDPAGGDPGVWADFLLARSTTLGARWRIEERRVLARRFDAVDLDGHSVQVKVALLPDGSERPHVEAEDLRRLARERDRSPGDLRREVERRWRETR